MMSGQNRDTVSMLLRRAIDDDGLEGENAWNMFVAKVKARKGALFFYDPDETSDPLLYVVRDLEGKVAERDAEIARLKTRLRRIARTATIGLSEA